MVERLIMAEGIGSGPEGISPGTEGQKLTPVSGEPTPQRPWSISKEFDPDRQDYTKTEEGEWRIFTDPQTDKKVARILKTAGGADEDGSEGTPAESPVPGLTAEDVRLFVNSGETVEGLNELVGEVGLPAFLQQARLRLESLGSQPTPEQLAQQRVRERAKRIEQLRAERERLQSKTANTAREKILLELNRLRINAELENLGGGGDGGGTERPGLEEGEPIPTDIDLEHEASPEKGRQIAREIMEQTALLYAGRLQEVNWLKLNRAYLNQRIHTEAVRLVKTRVKFYETEKPPPPTVQEDSFVEPEKLKDKDTGAAIVLLAQLLEAYRAGQIADRSKFLKEVDVYFEEAQRVGLLRELDQVLSIAWREVRTGIRRNQNSAQIMPSVNQEIQYALSSFLETYSDRDLIDLEINRLAGIGELYVQFAKGRFATAIRNRDVDGIRGRDYLDHEFHLGQEETGETFWRATHGWYIEVYAQTQEELIIAADSYISTLESITADPKRILDQATQFVEVLSKSDGAQKLLQTPEGRDFINKLTLGIEARVGVFGADDANERYANDNYKAYMDYINKDGKGPDRYLELVKFLGGLPAGVLWALDKDPRWETLFSLYGPRGQLSDASPAQRARDGSGLYNQLYDLLVEEMLGVAIHQNKKNLGNLTKFISDEDFANNFDGLFRYGKVPKDRANGDINIRAYQAALAQTSDGIITTAQLHDRRVRLGKIQVELNDLRERIASGEKITKKDGEPYDPSEDEIFVLLEDYDLEKKSSADAKFYKNELAKVKKAVDTALQIYGALGEKSKRGGGAFKTDKGYFVPVHMAEKFVQCGVTLTKIKYADDAEIWQGQGYKSWNDPIAQKIKRKNKEAHQPELKNFKAQYRTAKVLEAEKRAGDGFKKNGYEAKLYDEDGKQMKIKRPKEDSQTGKVLKDAKGDVIVEEVDADFYIATHHIYGNWSGHTYWSYQEEDRHMMLSDVTFAKARAIRDGKLRPEDADMWAEQLLILDPTLKRVRRFTKNFEDRERKLTMAAVEDSYQGHWRITEELYKEFFPELGTPTNEIGIYYGLQDFGGFRKMVEHARARAAEDPERFARRGRRLIPYLRIPVSPLSEYLGQGTRGALGAIMMLDAPIYRGVGTLALDKFHAQAEIAFKLYEALFIASKDEQGNIIEPLLLKLTNESDTNLQAFFQKLPKLGELWSNPDAQQELCVAVRKSFGRLERYEKLLSTMETMIRNASGAQALEEVDVLTDDGELEREVEKTLRALPDINTQDLTRAGLARFVQQAEEILTLSEDEFNAEFNRGFDDGKDSVIPGIDEGLTSADTGSGRHGARRFHNRFFEIFLDQGKRGGFRLYPTERFIYQHLKDKIVFVDPGDNGGIGTRREDIIDWLFSKFVPT